MAGVIIKRLGSDQVAWTQGRGRGGRPQELQRREEELFTPGN
jgi:hypothetical protein